MTPDRYDEQSRSLLERCEREGTNIQDVFAAALREMGEDSARLDWLDEVNRRTNAHYGTKYGWRYDINHNRAALTDHNWPPLTIREAIDAARDKVAPSPPDETGETR